MLRTGHTSHPAASGARGSGPLQATVALYLLCCGSPPVRAGGFTMTAFGARRNAMMANMANPDDVTAVFHNPAGLADQKGWRLHFSFGAGILDNWIRLKALDPVRFPEINPEGCGNPGMSPCPWPIDADGFYSRTIHPSRAFGLLPFLGASLSLDRLDPRIKNVTVGLGIYIPNFYGAFLPKNAPTAYHTLGGYFAVGALTGGVGWRINRHVSVGANLSYNYMRIQMKQKLSVVDALTPQGEEPSSTAVMAQGMLGDLKLDYEGEDHGAGWGLSVLVTPVPWFSFGLAYMGATNAGFKGPVRFAALGDMARDDPALLSDLLRAAGYKLPTRLEIRFPIPHSLGFGVNFKVGPQVEIGADCRIWFYNFYKTQVIIPTYRADEPGEEPLTRENLTRDKDYRLSFQVGAGVLARPWRKKPGLEMMVGLGYDHSPIPDHTFTLDNPTLSHIKPTVGVRWQVSRNIRLAAVYMLLLTRERNITGSETSPPTNGQVGGLTHSPSIEMELHF